MTRLVDADKIVWSIPPEESIARCIVANAPTVDAIPISFIEQFEKECEELDEWRLNYEGECHFDAPVISGLLEKWRKENDENKYADRYGTGRM